MPELHEPELVRLFDNFAARVAAAAPVADLPSVRARARRRTQVRLGAIAFASIGLLAVPVAVYVLAGGPVPRLQPGNPQDSGAPTTVSPSVSPPSNGPTTAAPTTAGPIEDTDWSTVTLDIPANTTGCAAGLARFAHHPGGPRGTAFVGPWRYRIGGGYAPDANPMVAYGDVDGDGVSEALLVISCLMSQGLRNPPSIVLLIAAQPSPHTVTLVFSSEPRQPDQEGMNYVSKLEVQSDGTVILRKRTFEGTGECESHLRWTGTAFTGTCQP